MSCPQIPRGGRFSTRTCFPHSGTTASETKKGMDPEGNLTQQISFTGYRVVDTKVLTTPGNMLGSQRISPILQKSFSLHISLGPLERLLGLVLRCVTTSEGAVTLSFGPPLKGKDPYCQRSETLHGSYNCTSPCASPKVQ